MKCPRCSFLNKKDGAFCQKCGTALAIKHKHNTSGDDLNDIIFRPKRKKVSLKNILILLALAGFIGFAGLIWLLSLEESQTNTPSTTQTQPTTFPISYLSIEDGDIQWSRDEAYFSGVLKNTYTRAARNVIVRLDFYRNKDLQKQFDTRRVTIEYGAEATGAFSFQVPLSIYPDGQFWYTWIIERAEYDF